MERDWIIRIAREIADVTKDQRGRESFEFDDHGIERFANLIAAAEREACAKFVYDYGYGRPDNTEVQNVCVNLSDAIRARRNHGA